MSSNFVNIYGCYGFFVYCLCLMAELHINSLKNSHQIREYEERKSHERRRNLLYLIAQYLKEENYYESAATLSNEAQLSSQYQVCDNIDLVSILQDFESYYYVRFQRYPKICKKNANEEGPFVPISKKPKNSRKIESCPAMSNNNKPSLKAPSNIEKQDTPAADISPIVVVGSSQPLAPVGDTAEDCKGKKRRSLKAFKHRSTEWMQLAETITKDILIEKLDVRWSDISGLEEAKRLLREAVVYPIRYPELFQGVLAPWRGLLLFGPPGTGKTMLARAVATECSTTFFNISASSVVSKWRGDSEKLVRVLFDLARFYAPSTIFLDEVDALASTGDCLEHEASRRLKTELLIQLDGLAHCNEQVFLLATSNTPWELDAALLRRLEKRVLVDLPTVEAREKMLKYHLPPILDTQPPIHCDLFYSFLSEQMNGYSGSDIRLVCKEAAMEAVRAVFPQLETTQDTPISNLLRDITTADVQTALDKTRPSAAHFGDKYITWFHQFGSL